MPLAGAVTLVTQAGLPQLAFGATRIARRSHHCLHRARTIGRKRARSGAERERIGWSPLLKQPSSASSRTFGLRDETEYKLQSQAAARSMEVPSEPPSDLLDELASRRSGCRRIGRGHRVAQRGLSGRAHLLARAVPSGLLRVGGGTGLTSGPTEESARPTRRPGMGMGPARSAANRQRECGDSRWRGHRQRRN